MYVLVHSSCWYTSTNKCIGGEVVKNFRWEAQCAQAQRVQEYINSRCIEREVAKKCRWQARFAQALSQTERHKDAKKSKEDKVAESTACRSQKTAKFCLKSCPKAPQKYEKYVLQTPKIAQERHKALQERPRAPPERPKSTLRAAKSSQEWSQSSPSAPKSVPRAPKGSPESF
jgi:hypothetical protein